MALMKAVFQTAYGEPSLLQVGEVPRPTQAADGDLLVKVLCTSVNPIDTKVSLGAIRAPVDPPVEVSEQQPLVVGWDVAGEVVGVGAGVTDFVVGEHVFFAGDIARPGSYAECVAVDARLVGKKPSSMSFEDAAALPLTALTAHETLVEKCRLDEDSAQKSLLIVNGAGGVGSIAIQYAKAIGVGTVIATASRPETVQWCKDMGADHVINHREDLATQLQSIGVPNVDVVAVYHDASVVGKVANLLKCDGHVVAVLPLVPDSLQNMDIGGVFFKRISLHMDCMFSRSLHSCHPEKQGRFLTVLAGLIDQGKIKSTRRKTLPLEKVVEGFAEISTGACFGKIVLRVQNE